MEIPFNAEAVKLNMDAVLDNRERHAWLDMVNEIKENVVVDEYTYKLVLKHQYYPTLTELGLLVHLDLFHQNTVY